MDMAVNSTSSDDHAFCCDHFCCRTHHNCHAWLNVRIPSLTNACDTTIFNTNIGFNNAPIINDQGIGQDSIDTVFTHPL